MDEDYRERALVNELAAAMAKSTKAGLVELAGVVVSMQRRIARLEARPELKYCGVWKADVDYREASVVTRSGSMWVAAAQSKGIRPGDGACWTLAVKHGKDMRA